MRGYLARPAAAERPLPGVLVIHENRGLNPHIEDIARRLALDGFIAFAPDALFPLGGYPGDEDKARELFAEARPGQDPRGLHRRRRLAEGAPECNGKIGAVGFCYGGGIVQLAGDAPARPRAPAVPFYGSAPGAGGRAARSRRRCWCTRPRTTSASTRRWPAYEAALKAANVRYEVHLYPGTQHGFNNDTTPRYDAAAAKLAWERTLAFFKRHLVT